MSLEDLLAELAAAGLVVEAGAEGPPVLRGPAAAVTPALRAALAEHRAALIRLHRAPGPAGWRAALARAEIWRRAAWAELAAIAEQEGAEPWAAEHLAWDEVAGWE